MQIARGVSYHAIDDKVYIHNVNSQKDYLLTGIALDVLNFLSKNPNAKFEDLCFAIAEAYNIFDTTELKEDLNNFIEDLKSEKILLESEIDERPLWTQEISDEVISSFAQKDKLFSMSLELTYRCVERCVHCYIDDASDFLAKNELALEDYKRIMKQARAIGCVKVLLTGGEVLLRKDFCDIVEYATSLGLIVDIYSTGVNMTNEIFDRLCATKINSISFSLYSGDAEVHDKITGIKGSFEKTLMAMLMFNCAGVQTFIKCVAMRQNFDRLESVYQLGRRLKIRVNITAQIAFGHKYKSAKDFRLNAEQYQKFFALEKKYASFRYNESKNFFDDESARLNAPPCSVGQTGLSIDPFGGVHYCIAFNKPIASVHDDSLENIWRKIVKHNRFKNLKLRNLTSKCGTCKFVRTCYVCIGDLIHEQGEFFQNCGDALDMAKARAAIQ